MDAHNRHNGQRDKRTDGWTKRSVSMSVRSFVRRLLMEFDTYLFVVARAIFCRKVQVE